MIAKIPYHSTRSSKYTPTRTQSKQIVHHSCSQINMTRVSSIGISGSRADNSGLQIGKSSTEKNLVAKGLEIVHVKGVNGTQTPQDLHTCTNFLTALDNELDTMGKKLYFTDSKNLHSTKRAAQYIGASRLLHLDFCAGLTTGYILDEIKNANHITLIFLNRDPLTNDCAVSGIVILKPSDLYGRTNPSPYIYGGDITQSGSIQIEIIGKVSLTDMLTPAGNNIAKYMFGIVMSVCVALGKNITLDSVRADATNTSSGNIQLEEIANERMIDPLSNCTYAFYLGMGFKNRWYALNQYKLKNCRKKTRVEEVAISDVVLNAENEKSLNAHVPTPTSVVLPPNTKIKVTIQVPIPPQQQPLIHHQIPALYHRYAWASLASNNIFQDNLIPMYLNHSEIKNNRMLISYRQSIAHLVQAELDRIQQKLLDSLIKARAGQMLRDYIDRKQQRQAAVEAAVEAAAAEAAIKAIVEEAAVVAAAEEAELKNSMQDLLIDGHLAERVGETVDEHIGINITSDNAMCNKQLFIIQPDKEMEYNTEPEHMQNPITINQNPSTFNDWILYCLLYTSDAADE